jgi:anti-sigma-K factor RskA
MNHEEFLAFVPLYALDTLPREEAEAVERHLADCAACRVELDSYHAAAASLIPDSEAPPRLWERISQQVDQDSSLAPVTVIRPKDPARPGIWRVVAGIAAAAALVLGGLVVGQRALESVLTGDRAIIAAAARAAAEPGSIVTEFVVDGVAVAKVVLAETGRGFVLPSEELPVLDSERTYQLWVINKDGEVISAGVLGNDPTASLFTWRGPIAGFALTREVAGGVMSSAGDVVSVVTDLG